MKMTQVQMDLFSEEFLLPKDNVNFPNKSKSSLFIIKDGEEVEMSVDEIFDKKYNAIKAITYSIDSDFINKHLSHFTDMEIIVGIQDSSVQARGFESIGSLAKNVVHRAQKAMENEATNHFQKMNRATQENIMSGKYKFKVPLKSTVHSKLYLLSNEAETRLIVGSANLSNQAFNHKTNQYEMLMINDNSEVFNSLELYFQAISSISIDYFNKHFITNAKNKKKKMQSLNKDDLSASVLPIVFTPQEQEGIEVESLRQYYKDMGSLLAEEKQQDVQEILEELVEPVNSINVLKKEKDREKQELIHAIELTKEIINVKGKDLKLSSDKVIKDKIIKKLTVKLADKSDTAAHDRPLLVSAPELRIHNNTGLYYSNSSENIIEKPLGQLASEEDIKHSIQSLQKLIQNYENYVIGYNHAYGTRIIEAILYAFTSPFIWELKNKPELSEGARTIPQFMILGGTANSGKSKLLTIIKNMMGLYGRQNWYLYSDIFPTGAHNKVSKTIDFLSASLIEENMTPLMVDELDEEFFSSAKRGENLIVNTANYFDNNRRPMPTFIGTTNSSNYSMNERGKSRTYYIRIDKIFDNKFEKHSTEAYMQLLSELDDKLFQDFIVRFSQKLNDNSINWAVYPESSNTGSVDFLYYTREIFKEYLKLQEFASLNGFRYQDMMIKKKRTKSCGESNMSTIKINSKQHLITRCIYST